MSELATLLMIYFGGCAMMCGTAFMTTGKKAKFILGIFILALGTFAIIIGAKNFM